MRLFASICLSAALLASLAGAVELRIICPGIVYNAALSELVDDYNKKSGNTAVIVRGVMDKIIGQAKTDTPAADVVGLPGDLMNNLYLDGGIVGATYTPLGRGELGLAVKKGAPKPDISTTEAFKRALLDAKSICYVEQGGTGIYLKELLERLGIAEQLKAKTKLLPPSNPAAHAVANGEAEIGMTQISEILPYAGAELVGAFPKEIELQTPYPADVGTGAREPEAAKALLKFLTTPAAATVLKAKGLEPG